jgi:hypothetical protein
MLRIMPTQNHYLRNVLFYHFHICVNTYFKVQFMQKFTQGFLPSSFNDVWVTNAVRRADQDHVELRNDADINIPFARFTRNVIEFNNLLKQHYLRKLSFKPNCNRLFCPQCMPPLNLLDSSSDSSDRIMYFICFKFYIIN